MIHSKSDSKRLPLQFPRLYIIMSIPDEYGSLDKYIN